MRDAKISYAREVSFKLIEVASSTGPYFYRRVWNSNKSEAEWYSQTWHGWAKVEDCTELEELYEEWDKP